VRSKDPRCPKCGGPITFFAGCGRKKVPCCDPCGVCFPRNFLENVERVHHYQQQRSSLTGLGFWLQNSISTKRLVVVVTARLVVPLFISS
jgi:hypothetical protein